MKLAKTLKNIVTEASTLNDYLSSRGINPKFVSRDTKISHAKSALFQKWKSDRKMTEESILEASESELLAKYLNSRGINPKYATKDMKIAHSKSGQFQKWKRDHQHFELDEGVDKKDTVVLDIPLLIRVLELAREDIKTDADLHRVVEKLISIRNNGVLTMDDYNTIANINENHIAIAMGNMLDDEGSMVLSQLEQLERAISMIRSHIGKDYEKQLPAWVQAKITLATDYADTVGNYITSKNEKVTEEVATEAWDNSATKIKKSLRAGNYGDKPTALDKFRQAAAERAKKHDDVEKEMKARHAAGKEDMKGSIDRLEKHLNKEETLSELNYDTVKSLYKKRRDDFHGPEVGKKKKGKEVSAKNVSRSISRLTGFKPTQNQPQKEETEHKVGDSVTVNSKFFGKQKGKVTKIDNQSIHVQRNDKKTSEKYPHGAVVKEEIEQIDELKKSTLSSYKDKSSASLKNAQANRDAAEPGKDMSKGFADLHAKSNKIAKNRVKGLIGYMQRKQGMKPTSENTLDSLAATEAPTDNSDMTNSTPTTGKSYAARMVKSLKKTVKEETYDWEKDDKSSMEKPYGKAPKMNVTDKTGTLGDTKPEARAVMKGGKTLTGQPRDMVEIDPSMKQRPGQQDKGQNTFTSPIAKKSPSL